eukprot:TRINITY_DN9319_c0_g2_i1.p1 TRINITY_DN9319_c0_g2~~TRINITY_DN9319_c0_g2_i1.p1  ORF type:complete len:454 (-),score=93.26 TRINITY_DN9319_c0_g2_i1:73-1434(-)
MKRLKKSRSATTSPKVEEKKEKKVRGSSSSKKAKDGAGGASKVKVMFEVAIKGVDQLTPDFNGRQFFVSWQRGRKSSNKGKTKTETVQFNFIQWEQKITITSTLLYNATTDEFEPKNLDLEVIELGGPKKNKKEKLGKVTLNLAEHARVSRPSSGATDGDGDALKAWGTVESLQFPILKKESTRASKNAAPAKLEWDKMHSPVLLLTTRSRWLKFDGKLLVVKGKGSPGPNSKDRESVQVGGVEYDLHTDMDGASDNEDETTLGGSDSEFNSDDSEMGHSDEMDDSEASDKEDDEENEADLARGSPAKNGPSRKQSGGSDKGKERRNSSSSAIATRGAGTSGSRVGISTDDGTALSLIQMVANTYKKHRSDANRQCYWLGFSCSMLHLFCQVAQEEKIPAEVLKSLPDIQQDGIELDTNKAFNAEALRGLPGSVRAVRLLEVITQDMYSTLIT